jgi:competence CoiA-like predicted nuclease
MTKQADLIAYIFKGQPHLLSGALQQWMESSSRFTTFVETYRDKIRKKIRVIREPESALDLHGELEVAYCLLNDRRLAVEYEPYASAKRRSPDFAVTYRDNLVFNIEVARIRVEENEIGEIDLPRKEERILRILLDKLEQMQPGMANLLVIHTREELARSIDLDRFMQEVKTRVEGKDPAFYAISRYAKPAAFYKDFLHLSGILFWSAEAQLWVNKQARPGLDEKVLRLISSLPSGASPT